MSTQILTHHGEGYEYAALYDSVTMTAFGPVFCAGQAEAEAFLKWLQSHPGVVQIGNGTDARDYTDDALSQQYAEFRESVTECSSCGDWVEKATGCGSCRKMECCGHEASSHDDEGCIECECKHWMN